jgi:hypothetical protein
MPFSENEVSQTVRDMEVDAAFLFRFDLRWYHVAASIREKMASLLGRIADEPLSPADGKRWIRHMVLNPGLIIEQSLAINERGYYCPLDESLSGAYLSDDTDRQQRWLTEAGRTIEIRQMLYELAEMYNLIPQRFETMDWGPHQLELQLRRIAACITSDRGTPDLFRWSEYLLVEQQRGQGPGPTIRPQEWAQRWVQDKESEGTGWEPTPDQYNVKGNTNEASPQTAESAS